MLPNNVNNIFINNLNWCFIENYSKETGMFTITDDDKKYFRKQLNVKNIDSAFVDFYSIVAFVPLGKGKELYGLEDIISTNELDDILEGSRLERVRFLQFTSSEGEGSYYYDVDTDAVFNVGWGEEDQMISGAATAWFESFYDFLNWYYS